MGFAPERLDTSNDPLGKFGLYILDHICKYINAATGKTIEKCCCSVNGPVERLATTTKKIEDTKQQVS